jgi:hypothetical protein
MVLITHQHLTWRLKKENSYTSNPLRGLHGLFKVKLNFTFVHGTYATFRGINWKSTERSTPAAPFRAPWQVRLCSKRPPEQRNSDARGRPTLPYHRVTKATGTAGHTGLHGGFAIETNMGYTPTPVHPAKLSKNNLMMATAETCRYC